MSEISFGAYDKLVADDCWLLTKHKGCCCDCKYQKPIVAHPWNETAAFGGSVNTIIGWGCNCPDFDSTVFFERKHGLCEMYDERQKENK